MESGKVIGIGAINIDRVDVGTSLHSSLQSTMVNANCPIGPIITHITTRQDFKRVVSSVVIEAVNNVCVNYVPMNVLPVCDVISSRDLLVEGIMEEDDQDTVYIRVRLKAT